MKDINEIEVIDEEIVKPDAISIGFIFAKHLTSTSFLLR